MTMHSVTHRSIQFFWRFRLGYDGSTQGFGDITTLRRFFDDKNYFFHRVFISCRNDVETANWLIHYQATHKVMLMMRFVPQSILQRSSGNRLPTRLKSSTNTRLECKACLARARTGKARQALHSQRWRVVSLVMGAKKNRQAGASADWLAPLRVCLAPACPALPAG